MAEADLSAQAVLHEWCRIAFSDPGELFTDSGQLKHIKDVPKQARQAISSMKVTTRREPGSDDPADVLYITEIKWWDKNTALNGLGKHLGLLKDIVEIRNRRWGDLSDEELIAEVRKRQRELDEIIALVEGEGNDGGANLH